MEKRSDRLLDRISFGGMLALFVLVSAAIAAAQPEALSDTDRKSAYQMLAGARKAIEANYYDATFKGHDLAALAGVAEGRIGKAGTIGEALAAIAQFELELDDLHTTFSPPWLSVSSDYGWKMGIVRDKCYVIALDPDSDAAHQGVAIGDQVKSVNGFVPTRTNLWRLDYLFNELHPLPGLHVELVSPTNQVRTLDLAAKVHSRHAVQDLSRTSSGFDRGRFELEIEKDWMQIKPVTVRSTPDVLLVRMPSFLLTAGDVRRQFRDMRDRAALILDLRGNGGGAEEALNELLGELYGDDFVLATRQKRGGSSTWTVKGAGRNAFTGRVLVLVDGQSASASELFARALQLTDRGTVIGDQTAGAVMEATLMPVIIPNGENVIVCGTSVTVADIVMSDGGRLEKVGVTPDFVVLPSAEDLNAGRDPALAQAFKFVGHPMDAAAAARLYTNR